MAQQNIEENGFKVKSSKHWVSEWKTKVTDVELEWQEIRSSLNENAQPYLMTLSPLNSCCLCDDIVVEGHFAVETLMFIPKNNPNQRFYCQIPRLCCDTCSDHELQLNGKHSNSEISTIRECWNKFQKSIRKEKEQDKNVEVKIANTKENINANTNTNTNINTNTNVNANANTNTNANINANTNVSINDQDITSLTKQDSDQEVLEDGFLICTQLVKTGGADQGGLQVGDIVVEFGHYSKARFPGLKSIATLVHKSAGKEIPVVVRRKLESLDTSHRTVYKKLSLKIKPLQSHDVNGGGVLGAVINTYPLPQTRV